MTRIPNSIAERTDKIHASDFKSKFICNVKDYTYTMVKTPLTSVLVTCLEFTIGCSRGHLMILGSTKDNLLDQLKDKPYVEGSHTCRFCDERYTIRLYPPA